jgi:hypothetical protein
MSIMKFKNINKMFLILMFFVAVCFTPDNVYSQLEQSTNNNKVSIKIGYKRNYKPGEKPISLYKKTLSSLLPELKNPSLLTYEDLGDELEKSCFIEGGFTFVLRGDFNKDGYADLAFIVKDQGEKAYDKKIFLVIVSIKGQTVTRELFEPLSYVRASLLLVPNYKKGTDGIIISYTINSGENEILYWNGSKYVTEAYSKD